MISGYPLPLPWLVTPLPTCSVVLERHTHKNGGSTLRSIVNQNDLHDGWAFWHYALHHYPAITSLVTSAMLGPRNASCKARRAPLRLVAEFHYSRASLATMLAYFGPFSPLQQVATRCKCKVVLVTRLREPLSYYVSFFRWTVSWRQQRNSTLFGATMLEWAPRNLQSSLLLQPMDASWAEFVGVGTTTGRGRRGVYSQFDEPSPVDLPGSTRRAAPGEGARARAELRGLLRTFDLVGLVERFDETLLMLADLAGFQRLLYTRTVPETTNSNYPQPSASAVCPDRVACERRIQQIAPFDHELYAEHAAAFDARVASLGAPFQARLSAFREANERHQAGVRAQEMQRKAELERLGSHDDDYQALPRVYARMTSAATQTHINVPMGRLKCPLGRTAAAVEGCRRLFADTPFRFNWRHTRESCCARLHTCLHYRTARRGVPNNCWRWLPAVADARNELKVRGAGYAAMMRAVNATLPTLCETECRAPPDAALALVPAVGRFMRPQSPSPASSGVANEVRTMVQRFRFQRNRCNDTPADVVLSTGKPWPDFRSCLAETAGRTNVHSRTGPCAGNVWMRVNCRRSCELCGLPLRDVIEPPPRARAALGRQKMLSKLIRSNKTGTIRRRRGGRARGGGG